MTTDRLQRLALAGAILAATATFVAVQGDRPARAQGKSKAATATASTPRVSAAAWALPVRDGVQVDLVDAPDGSLLMSWVEGKTGAQRLRLARHRANAWSTPVTIAASDSFGNSVDTPRIRQTADGAVWALWLRKGAGGGHARDLVLARSADGGRAWSKPVAVNTDSTPTEHGFVSTWAAGKDRIGVAWLDGRGKGHDEDVGDQSLRAVTFDSGLRRHGESVLDARVCDCCHTDVASTSRGPLLVYRDRSPTEVRDIQAMRLENGRWSKPHAVSADRWTMPACPVNGPAVAANGARATVAWYTAASGPPEVRLATSTDAGARFARAISIDKGPQVLGRVDTAMQGNRAAVVWLREDAAGQSLWLATSATGSTVASRPVRLAALAGRGRGTGMPRVVAGRDALHVVWTDVEAGKPFLRAQKVTVR